MHYLEHGLHVGAQHMHAEEAGVCGPLPASQSGSADVSSHQAAQRYGPQNVPLTLINSTYRR